jgi:hypothetical protein
MSNTLKIVVMNYIGASYWKNKKEKLLKKYNNLTDKDLHYNEGNEKEMIETLSKKLGKTKQELLKLIVLL